MIKFNKASITQLEEKYLLDALHGNVLSGDGKYTDMAYEALGKRFGFERMLLTTSGTASLEMASILSRIEPGDEVIVPSFTFSSTVNAFLLRGAHPLFCDIRPDTCNIDEMLIEELITPKTKAICAVDYAGVAAEMDTINRIAKEHGLMVIEDAAQALGSTYKGRFAGTLSELGCFSFHETKNYIMGEGGMIVVNDESLMDRAEIIREKGTNRRQLIRGVVDKYSWHDIGSSFLPSDLLAALLYAQILRFDEIMDKRMLVWNTYMEELKDLEQQGLIGLPQIPEHCTHNAHMFNLLLPTPEARNEFGDRMREKGIQAHICYVPLHSAPMGQRLGYHEGMLPVTESYGKRLIRLPLHAELTKEDALTVCEEARKILCTLG